MSGVRYYEEGDGRRLVLIGAFAWALFFAADHAYAQLLSPAWDSPAHWSTLSDVGCSVTCTSLGIGLNGDGLTVTYQLKPGYGWVNLRHVVSFDVRSYPVTFLLKASSSDDLEIKFTDADGSVFGREISLKDTYKDWTRVTVFLDNTSYWWGSDLTFGTLSWFELAVSGTGTGTIWIDEIGQGQHDLPATFPRSQPALDPDSTLAGIGFAQRRAAAMNPENPGVLEWLKVMQDNGSPDRKLVPSMEGEPVVQTFNNSLAAMAYIVKGERARAERILDFFAAATVVDNSDKSLQNFFYLGEARGFYQQVDLPNYLDNSGRGDRWVGDMAWLLCAYRMYDASYSSGRYARIESLLVDLLQSFSIPAARGAYIRHGWRNGDRYLHESYGHVETNIDCYAALMLAGDTVLALQVRAWLDHMLNNAADLPLDNYTWRVLAFGQEAAPLLNIPEYDFRYRKILTVGGRRVMGFYHGPDIEQENIWVDGTGHMACAYLAFGPRERGFFYANQLDSLLLSKSLHGVTVHALPYTVNRSGGYAWVDTTKGFTSCAAWYILAKNGVNPLRLTSSPTTSVDVPDRHPTAPQLFQNYPNPFNASTVIRYHLPAAGIVRLVVYDLLGREVAVLVNHWKEVGTHEVRFDGEGLAGGAYYYGLRTGMSHLHRGFILLK
jgi:hypothetical protein